MVRGRQRPVVHADGDRRVRIRRIDGRASEPPVEATKAIAAPLRVRRAVFSSLGPVGQHPFRGTHQPTLGIAHGILQAIAQHMKPGAVFVSLGGFGHRELSVGCAVTAYTPCGGACLLCTPRIRFKARIRTNAQR